MANTSHRGHGGAGGKQMKPMDPGAVGCGTTEYKEVAWINDYFLKATKWNDSSDYSANSVNQNLVNIVNNVNRVAKWSDINVSHHFNAFNGKATGAEVWYYLGDAKGRALAEKVSAAIAKQLGIANRGAKATTNLYVVSNTVGTTILIEWAFVDNTSDMNKWNANKVNAVNAVLEVLGYKGNNQGGNTVTKKDTREPHYVLVGWYNKNSGSIKTLEDWLKKEKMGYTVKTQGNKVWIAVGYFSQSSSWKRSLEKYLDEKDWSYVVCFKRDIDNIIKNW